MKRSNKEIAEILNGLYNKKFAGKKNQRFLIRIEDLRQMYPMSRIEEIRFNDLQLEAIKHGLYLFRFEKSNEDTVIAVIKIATIDRWRIVPHKIMREYVT